MRRVFPIVFALLFTIAVQGMDDPPEATSPDSATDTAKTGTKAAKDDPAAEEKQKVTASTYAFRSGGKASEILAKIEKQDAEKITPSEALEQLKGLPTTKRWAGVTRGQAVEIWVFHRSNATKSIRVDIDETPRETLFVQQFGQLVKLAASLGGLSAAEVVPPILAQKSYYQLEHVRANLKVTASLGPKEASAKGATLPAPVGIVVIDLTGDRKPINADTGSLEVITGPREGWSISADVGLNRLNQLKVSDENGLVLKEEKPSTFYAGFNFSPMGDLFLPPKTIQEAFTVKLMLSASRQPTSAYGIGFGLRPGYFANRFPAQSFMHILDTITPFVSAMSVREEEVDESGAKVRGDRETRFQAGISLDLKTAAGWLKPKKEEEKK